MSDVLGGTGSKALFSGRLQRLGRVYLRRTDPKFLVPAARNVAPYLLPVPRTKPGDSGEKPVETVSSRASCPCRANMFFCLTRIANITAVDLRPSTRSRQPVVYAVTKGIYDASHLIFLEEFTKKKKKNELICGFWRSVRPVCRRKRKCR